MGFLSKIPDPETLLAAERERLRRRDAKRYQNSEPGSFSDDPRDYVEVYSRQHRLAGEGYGFYEASFNGKAVPITPVKLGYAVLYYWLKEVRDVYLSDPLAGPGMSETSRRESQAALAHAYGLMLAWPADIISLDTFPPGTAATLWTAARTSAIACNGAGARPSQDDILLESLSEAMEEAPARVGYWAGRAARGAGEVTGNFGKGLGAGLGVEVVVALAAIAYVLWGGS